MKNDDKIDFVVLWVDPNDKKWQKERKKWAKQLDLSDSVDDREERYRDWGLFKYWFRGVEQFAPWVNKVHLVTCGHVPEWLNVNHPKLNIVKHSDFMPEEALPTFNSNAIELCLHRIPGLAERFVLFNDDIFITKKVKPMDFFKNGLPANTMTLFAIVPSFNGQNFHKVISNNIALINKHFDFNKVKKENMLAFLSLKQMEWIFFTYPLLLYRQFMGFRNYHISISYLKKTFLEAWNKEPEMLEQTVKCRFRDNEKNVSHWLLNYWQFASGKFKQHSSHFGKSIFIDDKDATKLISRQKYNILCLNDTDYVGDYAQKKKEITDSFDSILKEKSSFEV